MSGKPKLPTVVQVRVKENVTLENLHGIISGIGGIYGCRACGLLGIDLRLTGEGDPEEFQQIAKLPGVKSVGTAE
jgi:hypothetical protein